MEDKRKKTVNNCFFSNVGTVSFRKISVLKNDIIPFFIKYPLIGRKSKDFELWCKLVEIIYNKKHVGDTINTRNTFIEFAENLKNLNISRFNPKKEKRLEIILNWLKTLNGKPKKIHFFRKIFTNKKNK